jgi:hypothetical protein
MYSLPVDELLMLDDVLSSLPGVQLISATTPLSSELRTRVFSMLNSPDRSIDLNDEAKSAGAGGRTSRQPDEQLMAADC